MIECGSLIGKMFGDLYVCPFCSEAIRIHEEMDEIRRAWDKFKEEVFASLGIPHILDWINYPKRRGDK